MAVRCRWRDRTACAGTPAKDPRSCGATPGPISRASACPKYADAMTAITGPGYWRVTQGEAKLLSDDDGQRLLAEGGTSVVRIEQDPNGTLVGFQNSGAGLQLPNGQAMAHSTFTVLWAHE